MAQIYTLEPQTTAKVLMKTTFGDLELELWGKEAPLTTRNFLQLCLDGYYNETIFHRLVAGFVLQGGDPTGTGHGGEAIYPGGLFADEFHPRLKYNRRGLLGMANGGRRDDNGSQFFFTLAEAKELNGKNTLFGKIVGDTLYNLVRMGELETEAGTERPVYPPKVVATEVLVNPFEDLKPRVDERKRAAAEKEGEERKRAARGRKKKGGKVLLSFGADEEGEEEVAAPLRKKPKFDSRLVVDVPESAKPPKPAPPPAPTPAPAPAPKSSSDNTPPPPRPKSKPVPAREPLRSPTPPLSPRSKKLAETNAQIAALQASLRRTSPPPAAAPAKKPPKRSLLELQKAMLPATSTQARKRRRNGKGRGGDDEDEDVFAALTAFREKLASSAVSASVPAEKETGNGVEKKEVEEKEDEDQREKEDGEKGAAEEEGKGKNVPEKKVEEEDVEATLCDLHFIPNCLSCSAWDSEQQNADDDLPLDQDLWGHTLSFEKDRLGKDLTWKKKNEELEVIDPREKARELKGKEVRRDREGRVLGEKKHGNRLGDFGKREGGPREGEGSGRGRGREREMGRGREGARDGGRWERGRR